MQSSNTIFTTTGGLKLQDEPEIFALRLGDDPFSVLQLGVIFFPLSLWVTTRVSVLTATAFFAASS